MSEPPVDPALFRLRRFEEEWIAPLAGNSENCDPLNVLLLAEAQAWVSVGRLLGYFAPHQADMPALPSVSPSVTPIIDWIQTRVSLPHRLRADTFAIELSDAREDLTTERRELLQRVLFSGDAEWAQAITALEHLVLLLSDRADVTGAELAEVAWALEAEAVPQDDDETSLAASLPAGWRAGELDVLAELVPHTTDRIEELLRVRQAIAQMLADRYPRRSTELVVAEPGRPVLDIRETARAHAQAALHARWLAGEPETTPERLVAFGTAGIAAYLHRHEWIHRTAEEITCSTDDELTILRRLRIDFTVPHGLEPADPLIVSEGGTPGFYVPVSMIPKELPTAYPEVRSASGELLPILTRDQNGVIDLAMLLALAEKSAGDRKLPDELVRALEMIVRGAPYEASEALGFLLSRREREPVWPSQSNATERLQLDRVFVRTADRLVGSAILWARISGWPGERGVVELSYNVPTDLRLPWYSPEGLSWRALNVAIALPHIGDNSKYHLEIDFPRSVLVMQAQVHMPDITSLGDYARESAQTGSTASPSPFVTERSGGHRTSIDVTTSTGSRAVAWISLLAEKSSIRFAFLAALLNTALLIALYIDRYQILIDGQGSAAAAAFVAPIAAATLATRGARGPLAAALLGGVRRLAGVVTTLSLISAITLILTTRRYSLTFDVMLKVLIVLSAMISLLLLASTSLPLARTRRRWRHQRDLNPPGRYWNAIDGALEYRDAESVVPTAG